MAGIMDFLEPIWSQSYYTNKRTEDRAKQFSGLLAQQDQSQLQGPTQDGSLLGNRQLTPQFFMQAAAIPGYEQYGLQAQNGIQAMDRQTQNQLWDKNNMSAAQAGSLAEQQRQFDTISPYQQQQLELGQQNANTAAFGNYNMTPYQQAQLGVSQQNADTSRMSAGGQDQYKPPSGYQVRQDRTGIQPIPGSSADVTQKEQTSALQQGIDAANEYIDFIKKNGAFESGAAAKEIQQRATNLLVNAQAAASNSGVLNAGEAETYASRVPQVNAVGGGLFQMTETSLAQLEALKSQLATQLEAKKVAQGRASTVPPPPPGFKVRP